MLGYYNILKSIFRVFFCFLVISGYRKYRGKFVLCCQVNGELCSLCFNEKVVGKKIVFEYGGVCYENFIVK